MNMHKKILILSLSAGSGHVRAAESLQEEAQNSFQDSIIEHRDIIEFINKPLKLVYRDFYLFITKNAPLVWGYLYKTSNSLAARETLHVTSHIQALLAPRLNHFIGTFKPDEIICTHFVCAEVALSILKERGNKIPVSVVITDYAMHHLWIVKGVSHYFVATDAIKKDLIAAHVKADRVIVSGIPVSPAVVSTTPNPELYAKFKLKPEHPVVLALSGGFGLQDISNIIESLSATKLPLQICAVAGANTILKSKLENLKLPSHINLYVYNFIDAIHELYALADVVISKAGGLTVSECIARGLPLIITEPLPGQETANAHFLRTNKAALQIKKPHDALNKIHRVLTNPALRGQLAKNMRAVAQPFAARKILEHIMQS